MDWNKVKKVISYSLWGDLAKYRQGAIENCRLAKIYYKDWISRFYIDKSIDESFKSKLVDLGAEVIEFDRGVINSGMFWRFTVFSDPSVDIAIIRDTDSRLSARESLAVNEWLESGKKLHVIRDHPLHGRLIMGGMWGAKASSLRDIQDQIVLYSPKDERDIDQVFLEEYIYKKFKRDNVFAHDCFFDFEKQKNTFQINRKDYEFVGEVFNDIGVRENDFKLIELYEKSASFRLRIWIESKVRLVRYILKGNL
ncbi:MAG: hypothetical protein COW01_03605 [Bdellovibrionales bacterium CG12_big_fil_rev_8_21_14_0_65_38_15]|nr:MAG: hypothetical protein COW79_12170 [Bdellovibrionales bacterium CG22_combo_CG10-13_8_21_14_all_38_13]PIQ56788.1 MAG: hypothetical protein COW01_03605 [Bdellovibrionales bacterium CG12_big_fil_rev_8_21_14_0_65_38_15]